MTLRRRRARAWRTVPAAPRAQLRRRNRSLSPRRNVRLETPNTPAASKTSISVSSAAAISSDMRPCESSNLLPAHDTASWFAGDSSFEAPTREQMVVLCVAYGSVENRVREERA
jgi:hypothetical protein